MKKKVFKIYILLVCIIAVCGCSQKDNRDYNAEFEEYVSIFKEKYNIDLRMVQGEVEHFELEVETCELDEEVILALKEMEKALDKFPEGFIKNLKSRVGPLVLRDGIDLYIGGIIYGKNGISGGATSYQNPSRYTMVVNVNSAKSKGNIISHEMYHVIYNIALENENASIAKAMDETKWNSHNPEGFIYGSDGDKKYTVADSDLNEVHFVTDYSRTDMEEDMAEVFTYMMEPGAKRKKAFRSDHVKAKAKLISNMIKDNFDNIGAEPYWDRVTEGVILEGEYGVEIERKGDKAKEHWEIKVWNDGIDFKQNIEVEIDDMVIEEPKEYEMILQIDANFDGYNDILVHKGKYSGDIDRYEAYLWDESKKILVYNESFFEIPNPQIFESRKDIWGGCVDEEGKYASCIYIFKDGIFMQEY